MVFNETILATSGNIFVCYMGEMNMQLTFNGSRLGMLKIPQCIGEPQQRMIQLKYQSQCHVLELLTQWISESVNLPLMLKITIVFSWFCGLDRKFPWDHIAGQFLLKSKGALLMCPAVGPNSHLRYLFFPRSLSSSISLDQLMYMVIVLFQHSKE